MVPVVQIAYLFPKILNYKGVSSRKFIFSSESDRFHEEQIVMLRSNDRVYCLNAPFFEMYSCFGKLIFKCKREQNYVGAKTPDYRHYYILKEATASLNDE